MSATEMLSPLVDLATAGMESFVAWAQEHEWICRKSLFLVTPGEGLDAKALELADTISLDAGTMKVCACASAAAVVAAASPCVCVAVLRCLRRARLRSFVWTRRFENARGRYHALGDVFLGSGLDRGRGACEPPAARKLKAQLCGNELTYGRRWERTRGCVFDSANVIRER